MKLPKAKNRLRNFAAQPSSTAPPHRERRAAPSANYNCAMPWRGAKARELLRSLRDECVFGRDGNDGVTTPRENGYGRKDGQPT
jgi:hypothetical protein